MFGSFVPISSIRLLTISIAWSCDEVFNSIKPCGLDVQACNLKDYIDINVVNLKKELLNNFQRMLTKWKI